MLPQSDDIGRYKHFEWCPLPNVRYCIVKNVDSDAWTAVCFEEITSTASSNSEATAIAVDHAHKHYDVPLL